MDNSRISRLEEEDEMVEGLISFMIRMNKARKEKRISDDQFESNLMKFAEEGFFNFESLEIAEMLGEVSQEEAEQASIDCLKNGTTLEIFSWKDKDGKFHRTDGPASIAEWGSCEWHIHGEFHREDGPALHQENPADLSGREYYLYGEQLKHYKHAEITNCNDIDQLKNYLVTGANKYILKKIQKLENPDRPWEDNK